MAWNKMPENLKLTTCNKSDQNPYIEPLISPLLLLGGFTRSNPSPIPPNPHRFWDRFAQDMYLLISTSKRQVISNEGTQKAVDRSVLLGNSYKCFYKG